MSDGTSGDGAADEGFNNRGVELNVVDSEYGPVVSIRFDGLCTVLLPPVDAVTLATAMVTAATRCEALLDEEARRRPAQLNS